MEKRAEAYKPSLPLGRPADSRLDSQTTAFIPGKQISNHRVVKLECFQATAGVDRSAMALASTASSTPSGYGLTKDQIIDLFENCSKLASENVSNFTLVKI